MCDTSQIRFVTPSLNHKKENKKHISLSWFLNLDQLMWYFDKSFILSKCVCLNWRLFGFSAQFMQLLFGQKSARGRNYTDDQTAVSESLFAFISSSDWEKQVSLHKVYWVVLPYWLLNETFFFLSLMHENFL